MLKTRLKVYTVVLISIMVSFVIQLGMVINSFENNWVYIGVIAYDIIAIIMLGIAIIYSNQARLKMNELEKEQNSNRE